MFSIILKKKFITVALSGSKAGLNDRMVSMLDRLGLLDRLLTDVADNSVMHTLHKEVDWERVHRKLEEWRSEARTFLETAIGQV